MSVATPSAARAVRSVRPPGLFVEDGTPGVAVAPVLASGVPVFIGFARPHPEAVERDGAHTVVIERWHAREFERAVAPAPQSHLATAVRGFFANGGKRCVVLAVPAQTDHDVPGGSIGIVCALQRGGPLEERSDIDLVCIPDAASSLVLPGDAHDEIHAHALAHCEAMGDRFAILDADIRPLAAGDALATGRPLPAAQRSDAQDAVDAMLRQSAVNRSAFGALYFPWIAVDADGGAGLPAVSREADAQWRCPPAAERRSGGGGNRFSPPCGHVAGLYARIDKLVGAQRSPANEVLEGVVDTSMYLTAEQHGRLNEGGVNCLRTRRGRGVEVCGARTLSGHALWAHVSTARVVLGFRRWLAVGMREFAFEPQTTMLWDRVRTRLVSHCLGLFRVGALAGSDAAQAFFVQCDAETNPAAERDLGRVVAHVGLAPSVPAEFILVRVVHDASGFTVSGLS